MKKQSCPMAVTLKTSAFIHLSEKGISPTPIDLQDVLKFEKTAKRQIAIIREKGFRFPTNHQNPIYQVATELQRLVSGRMGVRISIQKNIPPQKGLGSWASASAKTIVTLNKLWDLRLSEKRLLKIGRKIDPSIMEVLKIHFQGPRQPKSMWAIVVVPKLIEIDRTWTKTMAQKLKITPASVAESHFPDLTMIEEALGKAGWDPVGLSKFGPAIAGFSKKRIGINKIPKNIQSKLKFVWIGKCL
jgi:hypothetical protein